MNPLLGSLLISLTLAGLFLERSRRAAYRFAELRRLHLEWLSQGLEWQHNPELAPELKLAAEMLASVRAELRQAAHDAALWCVVWAWLARKRRRVLVTRA